MSVLPIPKWQLSQLRLPSSQASTPSGLPFLKPTSHSKATSCRLATVRSGGFDSVLEQRKMVKVSSVRRMSGPEGEDDEGEIHALEQEAFISTNYSSAVMVEGFESTVNRQSKWVVVALFAGVVLGRHDPGSFWAITGSVINSLLSLVLKRILNQERPIETFRLDPGMPSSHAQSISFIVAFAILSITEWYGVNAFTVIFSSLLLALGSYLSWLRVSQKMHTISQVVVGAVLGFGFSVLWYWLWRAVVLNYFESNLWVRGAVIVGAVGFFLGFLGHVIRYWFRDDR